VLRIGKGEGHVFGEVFLIDGIEQGEVLAAGELLSTPGEQLAALRGDRALEFTLAGGLFPKGLLVELQGVGVGLDADLDRAPRLVGVDVVQGRGRAWRSMR
jgi:hypothetical protein